MSGRFASLAALALSGCATLPSVNIAAPAATLSLGAHYVAMGSSFASGPGIGPVKSGSPERCARAQSNYASLLAARLSLALDDQSCSGATTAHLLGAWDELPAQIDAVDSATRLVTITVGGNDLNYMGLLFTASCREGGQERCPPRVHLPSEDDYARTKASLEQLVRGIHQRAPDAAVVFVQYVSLVPDHPCDAIPIDATARSEARELARRLARITADAATATGALVLPVDQLSADHTPCDAQPWSHGFPAGDEQSRFVPWHPTAAGHAAIAAALTRILAG